MSEVLSALYFSVQGQERDVIIFSCVRTRNLPGIGFLDDKRRLNVAITRAKSVLIILGDIEHLALHDRNWRELLNDSKQRGSLQVTETMVSIELAPDETIQRQAQRLGVRASQDVWRTYRALGCESQQFLTAVAAIQRDQHKPGTELFFEGTHTKAFASKTKNMTILWTVANERSYIW